MLKLKNILLIGIMAAATFVSAPAKAELTEADVVRIVQEYVKNNGAELTASIDTFLANQQYENAIARVSSHTPVIGPKDAKVTVIEFSDFECPFCSRVNGTVKELQRRYKDNVRFAFKHLPLTTLHPGAYNASRAAQAAHRQGKFWEFRDAIFQRQEFSGEQLWLDVAAELKLDMNKFNKDRKSEAIQQEVDTDLRDAEAVGARGTPFFMINGAVLSGAQPIEAFVAEIEEQLKKHENAQ